MNTIEKQYRHYTAAVLLGLLLMSSTSLLADENLPYYDSAEFTPHWIEAGSDALTDFHRIPSFEFTNQHDQVITQQDTDQKVYVASFFFSTCPGICPKLRSKLKSVQDAFLDNDSVLILSHSIRPGTDTPEVLQHYAETHGVVAGKWHLLTGDQQSIYELARTAYFANEDLGTLQDQADFLHTENLLLIDQNRRIRGIYNGLSGASVGHLISDIQRLLQEV
ncbi:MAG: SCO family protein [Pseudomonadota bacterium]